MFFQAELEKAFGPDLHTPEMHIDQPLMKELCLLDGQWEECEIENLHEGCHRGIYFSAANVRLNHVYERGNVRDGLGTWRDMVFKGACPAMQDKRYRTISYLCRHTDGK